MPKTFSGENHESDYDVRICTVMSCAVSKAMVTGSNTSFVARARLKHAPPLTLSCYLTFRILSTSTLHNILTLARGKRNKARCALPACKSFC